MAGRSKRLNVSYFTQPTDNTCQSTVLKMFANYVEQEVLKISGGAGDLRPVDIYNTINKDPARPQKKFTNAHSNMKWWLEQRFPTLIIQYITTALEWEAIDDIVGFIDSGFPVLVAVSHANVEGHIVLVIGYQGYLENASSLDFKLVVHDPYGAFDPSLLSKSYGKQRFEKGMCLQQGGELGPGSAVVLDPLAASRQRQGDKYKGTFYLISASR
jgi:Peptidase_C39 like family